MILGGAGSIGGAILGGLLLSVMLDGLLRSPTEAGYLFYGVILLTLIVKMRPWRKLIAVLAATAVFGIVVHTIVEAISESGGCRRPAVDRLDRGRRPQLGRCARQPDHRRATSDLWR